MRIKGCELFHVKFLIFLNSKSGIITKKTHKRMQYDTIVFIFLDRKKENTRVKQYSKSNIYPNPNSHVLCRSLMSRSRFRFWSYDKQMTVSIHDNNQIDHTSRSELHSFNRTYFSRSECTAVRAMLLTSSQSEQIARPSCPKPIVYFPLLTPE